MPTENILTARSRLQTMIAEIQLETAETQHLTGISRITPEIVSALREIPRDAFVGPELKYLAYANRPLPVGFGQTVSQPFIVALMTQLLAPKPDHCILEIGTGSGYQAAILSRLVRRVISLEIIPELALAAQRRLRSLGINNVEIHHSDGYTGWPDNAPYDGIIFTACARDVPPQLIGQLAPEGILVIPTGEPYGSQELQLIENTDGNGSRSRSILPVVFVPFSRATG